jgi:hypothetical protein
MHFKSLQEMSLMPHEKESLFPPYSAFKVVSNRLGVGKVDSHGQQMCLRIILIDALVDNQAAEARNVPTAPRY